MFLMDIPKLQPNMTCRPGATGEKGSTMSFTLEMCLTISKENFLLDPLIKQQFTWAKTQGSKVFLASSDADLMIVQRANEATNFLCPQAKKECMTTNLGHSESKV